MKKGTNKAFPTVKRLVVALSGCLLLMPQTGLTAWFTEASNAELAGMRGRYAPGGNQIVYFGVGMVTRWQTANGRDVDVGVRLSVDAKLNPTITIVNLEHTGGSAMAQSNGKTVLISSGGITEVHGVAQSIQIGGDGNAVRNDVGMNITLAGGGTPTEEGGGMQLNTAGSQVFNNSNGSITTVSLDRSGLKLEVNVPGQGQILQQLRAGTGVFQGAMIGGDMNRIHNAINIDATMRAASGLHIPGMQVALDSLKGMRQMGGL
jgi:hypothetical protein